MKKHSLSTALVCMSVAFIASCSGSNDSSDAASAASSSASVEIQDAAGRSPGNSTPAAPSATATTTAGRLLASNCFGCHGTDGRPAGGFERLAGESASEIIGEMREMRTEDEGIMTVHALGYTDDQVKLLAQYFASR